MKKRILAAALAAMAVSSFGAVTLTNADIPALFAIYATNDISLEAYTKCIFYPNAGTTNGATKCALGAESTVYIDHQVQANNVKNLERSFDVYVKYGYYGWGPSWVDLKVFNDYWGTNYTNLWGYDVDNRATMESVNVYPSAAWSIGVVIPTAFITKVSGDVTFSSPGKYHMYDNTKLNSLVVKKGGALIIHPGRHYIKKLQIEDGAKVVFSNPGAETIINVSTLEWGGNLYQSETSLGTKASNDLKRKIARGFKIHVLGKEDVYVSNFAGTLYAPKSHVIVEEVGTDCNSSGSMYQGRIAGKNVTLEDCVNFEGVMFNPIQTGAAKKIAIDSKVSKEAISASIANAKFVKQGAGVYNVDPSLAGSSYTLMNINGKVVNQGVLGSSLTVPTYPAIIRVQGMQPQYLK